MLVLGIETSCDETAVSVVGNGEKIYSSVVSSSINFHKRYKGIVPEIASRLHIETISAVLSDALAQAGLGLKRIGLIAVTSKPGLPGSLLVGLCFARALSFAKGIPLLPVDHLKAHLYAAFFSRPRPRFPFIGLVVSGGHTSLFYVKKFSQIKLLGSTQDDACGEAFDKVSSMLGLGYPGGPAIEEMAKNGEAKAFSFNCSNTQEPLNFSFSGIKTALLYKTREEKIGAKKNRGAKIRQKIKVSNLCASFQEAVINALVKKSLLACRLKKTPRLVIGGGVAANNRLRERFFSEARLNGIDIYFSRKEFCTDNAAMVAGMGYNLYKNSHKNKSL